MANFLDTFEMPTAIADSTRLDLSSKHITTANWMQLNPVYTREMVPGEKIEVGVESFTRLNPLVVPTFAPGTKMKISRFFVPFRTIFRGWNDFITDTVHTASDGTNGFIPTKVPYFTNDTLLSAMTLTFSRGGNIQGLGNKFAVSAGTSADTAAYDYMVNDGIKYVYTPFGRQAQKVLQSLGYKLNPNKDDDQVYSALPLLAFAKVYADYYWPSAYMNSAAHYFLEGIFNYDIDNGSQGNSSIELNAQDICDLLRLTIFVCYDSDYFTSAFDNPVAPSDGNFSYLRMPDYSISPDFTLGSQRRRGVVTNGRDVDIADTYGTPYIISESNPSQFTVLTQYADSMLHRLTDYMKRHQLSGSRSLERYLSRFGKKLSSEALNRSLYLGTDTVTIQIGDVMSTSDTVGNSGTTGQQLGAYAGKGIAYSRNDYDGFSTDEYGIYIITSSIVPDVFYDQGIDYNIYHVFKSEFWTPEFDYGMRALTASELLITNDGTSPYADVDIHSQVFGFTPRYSEYRVAKSKLTGSFRVPTLNQNSEFGSDAWHMMREFKGEAFGQSVSGIVHSPSFVYGVGDAGQFNRLFYNSAMNAPDQFVTIYNFDVKSYAPYASLYDTYDWCDDQKGRKITMQANGVKVN